jgi:hypothetical protein
MSFKILITIVMLQVLVGCGSDAKKTEPTPNQPSTHTTQGSRILGMDIKESASISYAMAYDQAIAMGVREVSVSLDWELLEATTGSYDDTIPDIIESYYPTQSGDLTLILRPLDTAGPRLPTDLAGMNFDDPAVIAAFEDFLTHLHSRLTTLNASGKLRWIQVGNEIDAYLGDDPTKWAQWETFFTAAKAKIESLWGSSIEVSSIIQYSALNDPNTRVLYLHLVPNLENAVLTYYPLNADFTMRTPSTVATDFDFMVNTIANVPIILQECGYPSSPVNNSSESLQADFISAVFTAWDAHSQRIALIDISWQYDASETSVDQWVIDYGMSGNPYENAFKSYLATLGLSHYDGTDKISLQRLKEELHIRSWEE